MSFISVMSFEVSLSPPTYIVVILYQRQAAKVKQYLIGYWRHVMKWSGSENQSLYSVTSRSIHHTTVTIASYWNLAWRMKKVWLVSRELWTVKFNVLAHNEWSGLDAAKAREEWMEMNKWQYNWVCWLDPFVLGTRYAYAVVVTIDFYKLLDSSLLLRHHCV